MGVLPSHRSRTMARGSWPPPPATSRKALPPGPVSLISLIDSQPTPTGRAKLNTFLPSPSAMSAQFVRNGARAQNRHARQTGHPPKTPAPLGGPQSVRFSMARSVRFSVAIDSSYRTARSAFPAVEPRGIPPFQNSGENRTESTGGNAGQRLDMFIRRRYGCCYPTNGLQFSPFKARSFDAHP